MASPRRMRSRPRRLAESDRQAGPQNVSCATRTARATSPGVPSATDAHGAPLVGSMLSKRAPFSAATAAPPMKSSYGSSVPAVSASRVAACPMRGAPPLEKLKGLVLFIRRSDGASRPLRPRRAALPGWRRQSVLAGAADRVLDHGKVFVHDPVDSTLVPPAERVERSPVQIDDGDRVLELEEVRRPDDDELLQDLVLVVREEVAAGGAAHGVVEEVVVVEPEALVVPGMLLEAFDRLAHPGEVVVRRAAAGESRDLHLHRATRFEELSEVGLAPLRHESEERHRDVVLDHRDATGDAALDLDDAVVGEHPNRLADRGLADAELFGEPRDRRKPLAHAVGAGANAEGDLVDDELVRPGIDDGSKRSRVDALACVREVVALRNRVAAGPGAWARPVSQRPVPTRLPRPAHRAPPRPRSRRARGRTRPSGDRLPVSIARARRCRTWRAGHGARPRRRRRRRRH